MAVSTGDEDSKALPLGDQQTLVTGLWPGCERICEQPEEGLLDLQKTIESGDKISFTFKRKLLILGHKEHYENYFHISRELQKERCFYEE